MDTSALKTFAPAVRRQLLEAVERKLDYVLTADTADHRAAAAQVERLRSEAQRSRTKLIERVAYTWFNRLAALRFLDARGWHPFRVRVLTPATPTETQPEILRTVRSGALPDELKPYVDIARLNDLLGGRLPSADPQGEVYRHLVLAACRYYHALLPFLFERLDDETELLLPDDLLTEHSVAHGFRNDISDEDCVEVEILGWLYQFYISEKKDQVMARKTAVPGEDIPAVTQLFTPHWIVRYLVENSLGRLWLRSRPDSTLRASMPYYVEDPDGQAHADSLTVDRPEDIRLLDPACGSGHMLTYTFDLLYQIYEEEGHAPGDIPGKILTHNLYGLEICPRAAQLAQFTLLAKAREKSRSAFRDAVRPQVMCIEDVTFEADELKAWLTASGLSRFFTAKDLRQVYQFRENTSTFGSLIQPILSDEEIARLKAEIAKAPEPTDLLLAETQRKVLLALGQAEMLTQSYHVVATNPPYLGSRQMAKDLNAFSRSLYPRSKADLFAMFIERGFAFVVPAGYGALVTMHSWMFLSSFEEFRAEVLGRGAIRTMAHLGARAFDSIGGEVVQTTAFVAANLSAPRSKGTYFRLTEGKSEGAKEAGCIEAIRNPQSSWVFRAASEDFRKLPGAPLTYWVSDWVRDVFQTSRTLGSRIDARQGLATGDNDRFYRYLWEVSASRVGISCASAREGRAFGKKWFPINKGGPFRKWYGNFEYVISFDDESRKILKTLGNHLPSEERYFRPSVSWSDVTSSTNAFRYFPEGFLFDACGHSAFPTNDCDRDILICYCNGKFVNYVARILNPTIHFHVGYFNLLPFPSRLYEGSYPARFTDLFAGALSLASKDWDNFETSWDFQDLPLLRPELKGRTLEASWRSWERYLQSNIARMQALETENNRLWIEAYGLEDELTSEVPEEEITLAGC